MPPLLPPCPHLPPPPAGIDWRLLHAHREAHRRSDFYLDCLEYGHSLWQRGLAARAILCLDRAFGAELRGNERVLSTWPLPYAALVWILRHAPPDRFVGNPRVHFQHYAGRMSGPRAEERRWRAWACWALTRAVLPQLPGDPKHAVSEPSAEEIAAQLALRGHKGEAELWKGVLGGAGTV